ncbi:MAG: DNA methyltransferase [FCB group bacterium]|jgi:tRNA G10  N-methylase Trm11
MINTINKRLIDNSWNYETANTKGYTHCYHSYPAMMIPQVARRLIQEYHNKNTKILFDPYCGSGTSLLEANLMGINTIGTDLNPLARLIAKSKTTKFEIKIINDSVKIIESELAKYNVLKNYSITLFSSEFTDAEVEKIDNYPVPSFPNIDFWFSEYIKLKLAFIKFLIENKIDSSVRDFFLIPFSETIRESSYTRNSEFKLFRIPITKIKEFNVDPFQVFLSKINRNILGLRELIPVLPDDVCTQVFDFNTCESIPDGIFEEKSVDLIVTSPPYGDSRTTVAYGQFSRLSNQWLGFKDANQVDNNLMGGNGSYKKGYLYFELAKSELNELKDIDIKRYNDVQSFLIDYFNSIQNISKYIRKGGHVCYVLGNRTVKNIQIPLDLITVEIFSNFGFEHLKTIIRAIPNKKMPKMNSPTNVRGAVSSTMNNEYIVILRKQ